MKVIKLLFASSLSLTALFISNLNAALPPAYLKELDITVKTASQKETTKTLSNLNKKTVIALRSLNNGGHVYTKDKNNNKSATTVTSDGSATFLAFAYITPLETHFCMIKTAGNSTIIWLKSPAMEGKMLMVSPNSSDITFQKLDKNDERQQWEIESADGLNQVYFKNKSTSKFLGLDDDGKLICQAEETSKKELFKIVILD